jgi:[acyl-carrier-protein] S-malonyltransferase
MLPAQERLAFDLESVSFQDLSIPLVTNVDALANRAADVARDAVVRQVSAPVRWLESMQLLIQQGVENFVEVGPGKVLSGLMRQISREVKCFNVEDAASLKAASASLGVS